MRGLLGGAVVLAVLSLAGCGPTVRVGPPAGALTLVSREGADWEGEAPREPDCTLTPGRRMINGPKPIPANALPQGYCLVCAQDTPGRRDVTTIFGEPTSGKGPPIIVDVDLGGPRSRDRSYGLVGLAPGARFRAIAKSPRDWPSSSGGVAETELGLAFTRADGETVVGLASPPRRQFREVLRESIDSLVDMSWRGGLLVLVYSSGRRNHVVTVEGGRGTVRRVYEDDQTLPGHGEIGVTAFPQPGAPYLLFDRRPVGGRGSGLWLLNLENGKCTELTYETEGEYWHRLSYWEGAGQVAVFGRRRGEGWDIYRLHVPHLGGGG